MNDLYYLSHGGPGSGRYPWGSGDRPYQRLEGSRQRSKGILGYIKSRRAKKMEAQLEKAKEEAKARKLKDEENQRKLEADKERVLRSGTASEILRYQGQLTNKELSDAENRIRLENSLKSYSEKEIKTGLDTLKKIQSYSNVSSALAKDGISLWNSFASIYNVTPTGKKEPLPMIENKEKKK